jgi:hypothetical protein
MGESGALLTPSQREYLQGKSDIDGSAERMTKKRIRERISQTLVEDIRLLQQSIESDAVSIEYEDIADEIPQYDRRKSFSRSIVFVCRLAAAGSIDVDDLLEEAQTEIKEGRKKAIRKKLRENSKSVTLGELLEIVNGEEATELSENLIRDLSGTELDGFDDLIGKEIDDN